MVDKSLVCRWCGDTFTHPPAFANHTKDCRTLSPASRQAKALQRQGPRPEEERRWKGPASLCREQARNEDERGAIFVKGGEKGGQQESGGSEEGNGKGGGEGKEEREGKGGEKEREGKGGGKEGREGKGGGKEDLSI